MKYLIWSNQHAQWWAPNKRGYTSTIEAAGRYSYEQATRIVDDSTLDGRLVKVKTDQYGTQLHTLDEYVMIAPESLADLHEMFSTGRDNG